HLQLQGHQIRLCVIFSEAHHRPRVQVSFFHQILPDSRSSPLHSPRSNLPPRLHLQPRQYFFIRVFRAVPQLNFLDPRPWPRLHIHHHVHLVFLRIRFRIRGHLRGKKSFVPEHFPQSFQSLVHRLALV